MRFDLNSYASAIFLRRSQSVLSYVSLRLVEAPSDIPDHFVGELSGVLRRREVEVHEQRLLYPVEEQERERSDREQDRNARRVGQAHCEDDRDLGVSHGHLDGHRAKCSTSMSADCTYFTVLRCVGRGVKSVFLVCTLLSENVESGVDILFGSIKCLFGEGETRTYPLPGACRQYTPMNKYYRSLSCA